MTSTIQYASPGNPPSGVTPYRSLVRYTAPASEPVTLAEAKVQCRVDTSDDDAYITSLIVAARTYVEDILDISIMGQTWEARYDAFPLWEIILPRPPMAAERRHRASSPARSSCRPGAVRPDWSK